MAFGGGNTAVEVEPAKVEADWAVATTKSELAKRRSLFGECIGSETVKVCHVEARLLSIGKRDRAPKKQRKRDSEVVTRSVMPLYSHSRTLLSTRTSVSGSRS